ncbi:Hsp70 family protein [Cetobacterium somerae]
MSYKLNELIKIKDKNELIKIARELNLDLEIDLDFLLTRELRNIIISSLNGVADMKEIEDIPNPNLELTEISSNNYIEMKKLEEIFQSFKETNELEVDVPNQIEIFEGTEITEKDEKCISSEEKLAPIVVISVDNEFCGYMTIAEKDSKQYLNLDPKNIMLEKLYNRAFCDLSFFKYEDFENLKMGKSYIQITKEDCRIKINRLLISDKTLCIDFGTTNTALGIYTDKEEPELVTFIDVLNNKEESPVIPTLVWIEDCSGNEVKYVYGYEARKKILDSNFKFKNTIFYELKKWIGEGLDVVEVVIDGQGYQKEVSRKEIIQKYLEHIILAANNHFKCKFKKIHMSAPVKLKNQYIEVYKEILEEKGYKIPKAENSLDEGIAVIYNNIRGVVRESLVNLEIGQKFPKDADIEDLKDDYVRISIVDVGGGTTDVASCDYAFERTPHGCKLDITTNFENGDSNFGGNNITFKILQYLKIRLANYFQNKEIGIEDLIELSETQILDKMEANKKEEIYGKFESKYKEANQIVPTDFNTNELFNTKKGIEGIRKNYYQLWEMADTIKKEFFKRTDVMMIDLRKGDKASKKIRIPKFEEMEFFINKDGKLNSVSELPDLSISIKEIEKLIYGEIYGVLKNIFREENKDIVKSHRFRLSGQTCKISLFSELIKEFIAGRKLRKTGINTGLGSDSLELKLHCIKGSILYINDIERGVIDAKIKNNQTNFNYKIKILRGAEIEILSKNNIEIQQYEQGKVTEAKFKIYDIDNKYVKDCIYRFKKPEAENLIIKMEDILDQIIGENIYDVRFEKELNRRKEQLKIQLENSRENGRILMTIPSNFGFGFKVLDLYKDEDEYLLLNSQEFNFEKSTLETSFFNGGR